MRRLFAFLRKKIQRRGDDTMSALARNYAYVMKTGTKSMGKKNTKEAVVTSERARACKAVVDKYPMKK